MTSLSDGCSGSGPGREAYYTRELATDDEQYLPGLGKSPGRWCGAGATSLGLQGEASPVGFGRMFEGRDPDTWELLGRPHGRSAVPACDVVLRPTKSVSVLYEEQFAEAVTMTLDTTIRLALPD